MNPVRWRYLSSLLLCLSVAFLVSTLFLPLAKSQQELTYLGPAVPYVSDTSLSGYYVPPVAAGSQVEVSLTGFTPESLYISVFPTRESSIAPSDTPVYYGSPLTNSSIRFFSAASIPYGIYIVSHNRTTYTIRIEGVFSQFYWLGTYLSIGVFLTVGTGALFYYYTFAARKWKWEQEALKGVAGSHREPE